MLKIFLIERKLPQDLPEGEPDPWAKSHDKKFGFLIAAEDEQEAREMAHFNGATEKREMADCWLDYRFSDCEELGETEKHSTPVVMLHDFRGS